MQASRTQSVVSAYTFVATPLELTRPLLGPFGRDLVDRIAVAMRPRCEKVDVVELRDLFDALASELVANLKGTPLSRFSRADAGPLAMDPRVVELQWFIGKYDAASKAGKGQLRQQCRMAPNSPLVHTMQSLYWAMKSEEFNGVAKPVWEAPLLKSLDDLLPRGLKDSPLLRFARAGLKDNHNVENALKTNLSSLTRFTEKYELASEAAKRNLRRKFQDEGETPLVQFMRKLYREIQAEHRRHRVPVHAWEAPLKAFLAEMFSVV